MPKIAAMDPMRLLLFISFAAVAAMAAITAAGSAFFAGSALFAGSAFGAPVIAANLKEADYQKRFCAGMALEVSLGAQRRADCLDQTHAIEVDWSDKWKEGIGQSMAYAAATGLLPGVILVCRRDPANCRASSRYTRETFSTMGVSATIWQCSPTDQSLKECIRREVAPGSKRDHVSKSSNIQAMLYQFSGSKPAWRKLLSSSRPTNRPNR